METKAARRVRTRDRDRCAADGAVEIDEAKMDAARRLVCSTLFPGVVVPGGSDGRARPLSRRVDAREKEEAEAEGTRGKYSAHVDQIWDTFMTGLQTSNKRRQPVPAQPTTTTAPSHFGANGDISVLEVSNVTTPDASPLTKSHVLLENGTRKRKTTEHNNGNDAADEHLHLGLSYMARSDPGSILVQSVASTMHLDQLDDVQAKTNDMHKALEHLTTAANMGSAFAHFQLGRMYSTGLFVNADPAKAAAHYKDATNGGVSFDTLWRFVGKLFLSVSHVDTGVPCHENDFDTASRLFEQDKPKESKDRAIEMWTAAARSGCPKSQFQLGLCYFDGIHVAEDSRLAMAWWTKAAAQDHAEANYRLGDIYQREYGVKYDLAKIIAFWKRAADLGHGQAQCEMGIKYLDGTGVDKNLEEAVRLFSLAAKQQVAKAEYHLAVLHSEGNGVPEDMPRAIGLWTQAAAKGFIRAKTALGKALRLTNKDMAMTYLMEAAPYDEEASTYLHNMSSLMVSDVVKRLEENGDDATRKKLRMLLRA